MRRLLLLLSLLLCLPIACGGNATGPQEPGAANSSGAETGPRREREAPRLSDAGAAEARTQALQTHTLAGQAYDRCMLSHGLADCVRAQSLYGVAADTWASLLRGRASDADAPEWRFMQAQALFRADRFAEAADAFERHLDVGVPEEWIPQAAFMLVTAHEHLVEQAMERGDLARRRAPPDATGEPPRVRALDIPPAVARLDAARARYAELVDGAHDTEQRRRQYALAHALSRYLYGHFDEALPELVAVFDGGCAGDAAWLGARAAFLALRQIALARGQFDALAELGQRLQAGACTFGGEPADCQTDAQHPTCLARADARRIRQIGGQRFMQRAQQAEGAERARWATRAGESYLASLASEPPPDAFTRAETLAHAVSAFELAGASEALGSVDEQLMALRPDAFEGSEREFVVQELSRAIARRLAVAQATGDTRAVLSLAPRLLDEALDSPDLALERQAARLLLAQTQASRGQHREAALSYRALAQTAGDPGTQRTGALEAAIEDWRARGCRRGRAALASFADAYTGQDGSQEAVVRALWTLASCERAGTDAYYQALGRLNEARASTPGSLSLETREHAAEAAFRLADRDFEQVARLRVRLPRVDDVEEFGARIPEVVAEPAARVARLVQSYDAVMPLGSSEWSVAAASRAAAAVQALMDAIVHAEWELPTSVRRMLPQLNQTAASQIRQGTEARINELLEQQSERLRCSAAARFAHAANMASDDMHTRYAEDARRGFAAVDADVRERCRQHNPGLFN